MTNSNSMDYNYGLMTAKTFVMTNSTYTSLPDSLRDPALSLDLFGRQLKT